MVKTSWRNQLGSGRGGLAVLAYAVSLAVNFYLSSGPSFPTLLIASACAWNIFLFWPEIRSLKVIVPKGTTPQSAKWLLTYAFVGIGCVIVASVMTFLKLSRLPRTLTSDEFAQPFISGKYFHIADLADKRRTIAGRTFENDWIYGPAVLYLTQSSDVQGSQFLGTFDQLFQPVQIGHPVGAGVVIVSDGKFRNCHFIDISFVASPEAIEEFRHTNTGAGTTNPNK